MTEPALTVKEVAELLAVSKRTVLAWIRSGELRAVNCGRSLRGGKPRWRVTREALQTFELIRTASAPAPRTQRRKREHAVLEFY